MKVFGHHIPPAMLLFAAVDLVAAMTGFWLAWGFVGWPNGPAFYPPIPALLVFGAVVGICLTSMGLYQANQRVRLEGMLARVCVAHGIAVVVLASINFAFSLSIGRGLWIGGLFSSLVLVGSARVALWRWIDHTGFRQRVLVYGAGQRAAALLKLRRRSDTRGFSIEAFLPAEGDAQVMNDARVQPPNTGLLECAKDSRIDEIVVAMDDRRVGFPVGALLDCKFAGISVIDLLTFLERETGKVRVDLVNPSWLIFSEGFDSASRKTHFASRAMDVVVSTVLLILTAPIMALVALAVVIDDGLPVIYRQRRVGYGGRTYWLYKFRSMIKAAEADGAPKWARTDDQRVTRVGGILRKLRLDELPQLVNVLRGDMSLVGPRPERPEFVERLSLTIPYYQERHVVKPGITGWAQLCYPYGSSDHDAMEKLQYDLYYIKHKSLIFDLMVLLQTAEVVLWGKGAR
jgi:sugar transferase (PEP-CTERM system associated)